MKKFSQPNGIFIVSGPMPDMICFELTLKVPQSSEISFIYCYREIPNRFKEIGSS